MRKQVKKPTRESEVQSSFGNKRRDGRYRKTESSDRSRLEHNTSASQAGILCDDQSRREQLSIINSNINNGRKVTSVPVVSSTGKPLMPCSPARAQELMKKGKAKKQFTNQIFYIKLTQREDGDIQTVACGIDPGSKKEGFTVKSSIKTFINILSETTGNFISDKIEKRRSARRSRRFRKTPFRKNKMNRNNGKSFLPPSTRARWNAKLRIADILRKIYPISDYVVEDIKAVPKKGKRKWNKSFSPLEVGKNYFYDEIRKIGRLTLMQGHETAAIREELGLIKTTKKLDDVFEAHNVDSWVLANLIFNIQKVPDNKAMYKFVPMIVHRRQLHTFQFSKGGIRKRYGGTVSLGIPKRTVCRYRGEYLVIGGNMVGMLSLNRLIDNKRMFRKVKKEDVELIGYIQRWNVSII